MDEDGAHRFRLMMRAASHSGNRACRDVCMCVHLHTLWYSGAVPLGKCLVHFVQSGQGTFNITAKACRTRARVPGTSMLVNGLDIVIAPTGPAPTKIAMRPTPRYDVEIILSYEGFDPDNCQLRGRSACPP